MVYWKEWKIKGVNTVGDLYENEIFMKEWKIKGVNTVGDLYENEIFMSYVDLQRKYNFVDKGNFWKRELNQLQHDHNTLVTNLALVTSSQRVQKDINDSALIRTLIQSKEEYDCLAEQEKNLIARLDAQIKEQEEKIIKLKMSVGGIGKVQQRRRHLQKQIQTLENQLNLATVKFNSILAENCKLREEMNSLRANKEIYTKLYNKLSAKLQGQKKIMRDIVEDSIQAYDQRMEAESRINAVKEKSAKDFLLYNTEIKELMRIIDHETKLKEFMLIKFRQFSKEGRLFHSL
ncbi:coiled-coil domain-containing protein 63-like [Hypanus sabinus]|uniref:coiled-coil domain-containing protein 63-like n=1 Tax=Hypanus sabinus TaxID=79690 RepID=UPI0028C3A341|nr:coiled-coil domain-containing protein 63-like [Hypanus sabinus]